MFLFGKICFSFFSLTSGVRGNVVSGELLQTENERPVCEPSFGLEVLHPLPVFLAPSHDCRARELADECARLRGREASREQVAHPLLLPLHGPLCAGHLLAE